MIRKITPKFLVLGIAILINSPLIAKGALVKDTANICAYGGAAPSYFGAKKKFTVTTDTQTFSTNIKSFHDHFRFPFIFGGSAGYSFTRNFEINLSADFTTARGDSFFFKDGVNTFKFNTGTFGTLGCYIGARYYIDCGSCWYPFVGLRAGVQNRRQTQATLYVNDLVTQLVNRAGFFHRQTVGAGGASLGFDGPLTDYVNFFIMGEINYSGKLKSQNLKPYDVYIKSLRTHPIVVGLRLRAD